MSELKTFFRRCPNCGRRFEIRLLTRKLLGERIVTTNYERPEGLSTAFSPAVARGGLFSAPHVLEESVPLSIDEQEFKYSYKCKHCDHQWVEVVDNERKVG